MVARRTVRVALLFRAVAVIGRSIGLACRCRAARRLAVGTIGCFPVATVRPAPVAARGGGIEEWPQRDDDAEEHGEAEGRRRGRR